MEFRSLDLALSQKRYILLVQVGKEGWDCPSLTGVILSQKGDSPQNMLLQTSCRCLRQVDKNSEETALIWLNKDNADTLNKQLKQEQNSSIDELNTTKRTATIDSTEQENFLLSVADFSFKKRNLKSTEKEKIANTKEKLQLLLQNIDKYKVTASISTSGIRNIDTGTYDVIDEIGVDFANYNQWIFEISRQSFGLIHTTYLHQFDSELKPIFEQISYLKNDQRFFNALYDLYQIQSRIRVA